MSGFSQRNNNEIFYKKKKKMLGELDIYLQSKTGKCLAKNKICLMKDGAAYGCCGVERSRSFNVFVCLFCV